VLEQHLSVATVGASSNERPDGDTPLLSASELETEVQACWMETCCRAAWQPN
jgi:hypothetical protein